MGNVFNTIIAGINISIKRLAIAFNSIIIGIKIFVIQVYDLAVFSINTVINSIISLANWLVNTAVSFVNYLLRLYLSCETGVVKIIQHTLVLLIKIRWGCIIFTCLYGVWKYFGWIAFAIALCVCMVFWYIGRSSAEAEEDKWNDRINTINSYLEKPIRYLIRFVLIILPLVLSFYSFSSYLIVRDREIETEPKKEVLKERNIKYGYYKITDQSNLNDSKPTDARVAEPPIEIVTKNVCPFEGCQLGNWIVRETLPVYKQPGGTQTWNLQNGDKIYVMSSESKSLPRKAIVTNVYKTDEEQGVDVGSIVYVLCPLGEGAVAVWHKGKVIRGSLDLSHLRYETPIDSSHPLKWTWWVHVRLADGTTGWLKNPQGLCDGIDAFG
jgi:hypothetical protein